MKKAKQNLIMYKQEIFGKFVFHPIKGSNLLCTDRAVFTKLFPRTTMVAAFISDTIPHLSSSSHHRARLFHYWKLISMY